MQSARWMALTIPASSKLRVKALAGSEAETVIAALGVLRSWVAQETGTRLLEAITAIAVDRGRDARIRVAAIDALADLPEHLVRPIREQAPPPEAGGPPLDNPVAALGWVEAHGGNVTLATLLEAIKKFRDSEGRADTSRGREEWLKARALAHRMLADRGSRLALYDARETFSAAQAPLPPGFLDAIGRVGDASCLEPLARAWSASRDAHWRDQLSERRPADPRSLEAWQPERGCEGNPRELVWVYLTPNTELPNSNFQFPNTNA